MAQEEIKLTINDIAQAANIIEVAIQRGAFRAKEVTAVGTTYDRLQAYVDQHSPKEGEEPPETTDKGGDA